MAYIAAENGSASPIRSRRKRAANFVLDPATGALELTAQGRLEAEKAILREVQRMKFAMYRERADLELQRLFLKGSLRIFDLGGDLLRRAGDFFGL